MKKLSFVISFAALILYLIVLTYFSMVPSAGYNLPGLYNDKFRHFLAYFILAILLVVNMNLMEKLKLRGVYFAAFIISFSYGLLMEMAQSFVPFREFDIKDVLSNFFGAIFILSAKIINPILIKGKIKKV